MSTSPQRVSCSVEPSTETLAAAGTVFAMLDLLTETDCSPAAQADIALAIRGAEARLGELGVSRPPRYSVALDPLGLGWPRAQCHRDRPPPNGQPGSNVIPLPAARVRRVG
jgi:hypothetical protein